MTAINKNKPTGRPSKYTEALADKICMLISEGVTIKDIANQFNISVQTIHNWLVQHEYFRIAFHEARDTYAEVLFQEMLTLEQRMLDGEISAAGFKASADVRKWILAKLSPKRFGDKIEVSGTIDIATELQKRLTIIEHSDG